MPYQQCHFLESRTSPANSLIFMKVEPSFCIIWAFGYFPIVRLAEPYESHFFPNSAFKITFPIFRSTPALDVGRPVFFAISLFTCVMPNARFHEKLRPGMGDDFLLILTLYRTQEECFLSIMQFLSHSQRKACYEPNCHQADLLK